MAKREALQINTLSMHSLVKMPIIYHVHESDNVYKNDALLMEYIQGVNAGNKNIVLEENNRLNIAEMIVDNLISYHKTINKEGFGEINSDYYESDWNTYYKKKAEEIIYKAEKMSFNEKIPEKVYEIMNRAMKNYAKIFYIPITTARLIHGDYNTWNVILDEKLTQARAIIDPYNCCWADSEFDLYQLNNANGRYYGLFSLYSSKYLLSKNYKIKMCFYEMFTEIMHYYDANIDTKGRMNDFLQAANDLNKQMEIMGI